MKKYFIILIWGLLVRNTWGQVAPTNNLQEPGMFIGLNNGQRVYARKLQIKSPIFKKSFILVNDSAQYDMAAVQYFQDQEGFYTRITNSKRSDFAKRILVGKISKFYSSKTSYDNYYPGMYGYGYGGYGYGMPSTRRVYYFSKDGGPLADLNYQNLRSALSENAGSMEVLEKYRRGKRVETGLTILGSGVFVYGLINSLKAPAANAARRADPTLYLGIGLAAIPWVMNLFQKDHLNEAIELYNYDLAQQPSPQR